MSTVEFLPPNYTRLDSALRSIGYTLEAAVADIIDNSIDAKATDILVRLYASGSNQISLAILDNGAGMSSSELREAMVFGADVSYDVERLGKFGMGLKLASLSQARGLHVISAKAGHLSGRGWPEGAIASGFQSTVLTADECRSLVTGILPDRRQGDHWTLVVWTSLYRTGHFQAIDPHIQVLLRRLRESLSLAFHRFLSGKRGRSIRICLDVLDPSRRTGGIPVIVSPLDPFGYSAPGHPSYPKIFRVGGELADHFSVKAHIWPANAKVAEYRLPGGANARQGFYFYRNNRLLQGGGWNGYRDPDPHTSLARVAVDLSPDADVDVSLDIKKVQVSLPPRALLVLTESKASDGTTFRQYISQAERSYRTRGVAADDLPLVPSAGLPKALCDFLKTRLRLESTARVRPFGLTWGRLKKDRVFELDRDGDRIVLNKTYRSVLLGGSNPSAADAPIIKTLLFFCLREIATSGRLSSGMKAHVDLVNDALLLAVRHESKSR